MKVTAAAISLTVDDVDASGGFLTRHFGFREEMAADGFVSLLREDAGLHVIYLRRGIEVLPEGFRDQHAAGVIVALVVADADAELARLRAEGVEITLPMRQEEWGERLFQVTDPNGVIVQITQWV